MFEMPPIDLIFVIQKRGSQFKKSTRPWEPGGSTLGGRAGQNGRISSHNEKAEIAELF